ncbi:MAG: hypothetical protein Ct9H300mP4_10410 [Gammaproteobacteria bacterium]|nr:MAG: hypothetical protein Ct9H300mP4_10410 [Gammaproteobacteria bacterium]
MLMRIRYWGEIWGSKFSSRFPFRLAVEDGLLDPKRTIQIGIRGGQNFLDGIDFSLSNGMRVVFIEEFAEMGVKNIIEEARNVVGDGPHTSHLMWTVLIRFMHQVPGPQK